MTKILFSAVTAIFVLLGMATIVAGMRKQGVAISGKFLCGSIPTGVNSTKVKLVDIDTGPDPDDKLDEAMIDGTGTFKLKGFTRELSDIDPVLYVWTDCNDGNTPCQRKITIVVPKKFIIGDEPKPTEWVDIGVINLQNTFEEEKRECAFK